jgi:outer membrane protein
VSRAIAPSLLLAATALSAASGCATPSAAEPGPRPPAREPAAGGRAATGPSAPTSTAALSLERCIEIALERNRTITLARLNVLIARDTASESFARVLPEVVVDGQFRARSNDPGFQLNGVSFIAGDRNVPSVRVGALVPIYDFDRSWGAIEADRERAQAAELSSERTRQDLVLAVTRSYFRVLEAEKIRGVVEQSIAAVSRQLAAARDQFAQGVVARNEVLAAEVQLAERRQEMIRAENNVELAKAALDRVMGVDVTRPVEVADVFEPAPWSGSFEAVLEAAIAARPDLLAARREVEAARADWRSARGGFFPRIFAFGSYNYVNDDFMLNKTWWEGGFGVELPVFEGGAALARLDRAREAIAAAVARRDERMDDLVLAVKQAYLDVREAAARIPVAREAIGAAEEDLRVTRDQYDQGLVTSTDVLFEEDRLSRARSSYYRALYDYHDAFARLSHAVGGPF